MGKTLCIWNSKRHLKEKIMSGNLTHGGKCIVSLFLVLLSKAHFSTPLLIQESQNLCYHRICERESQSLPDINDKVKASNIGIFWYTTKGVSSTSIMFVRGIVKEGAARRTTILKRTEKRSSFFLFLFLFCLFVELGKWQKNVSVVAFMCTLYNIIANVVKHLTHDIEI